MELAAALREEALATNERRLLVLAGAPERTRTRATETIKAANSTPANCTYLGSNPPTDCERLDATETHRLLGTTREMVILDCHERCEPNALGRTVGAVDGGGLLVLLTPPLDEWPTRRDGFDATLAIPPFSTDSVGNRFRTRLVSLLREHPGIAIYDVDTDTVERDGHISRAPALSPFEHADQQPTHSDSPFERAEQRPTHPDSSPQHAEQQPTQLTGNSSPPEMVPQDASSPQTFPPAAYEACLTRDQQETLRAFERLSDAKRQDGTRHAVVVEADRGRGKSSVAGLAAAALALEGNKVLVTAPQYRSTRELFARASELLARLGSLKSTDDNRNPHVIETATGGWIQFALPVDAITMTDADCVFVDEAAGIPVALLSELLITDGAAFLTTVHGYEGAGRGFSIRFREQLAESAFSVTDVTLAEPIRYAPGDPIEVWSFRALALNARPPVASLVADATPATVTYRRVDAETLVQDEPLLMAVFGLLVGAHYRTEPNDLARLLDAPNITVHALCHDGWPVSVALLASEGGLDEETCRRLYAGGAIRGNFIPDLLASQLRDERAPTAVGHRVLRIATHQAARSRGLGSMLLSRVRESCDGDWLGVGFGATPRLLNFWAGNGFQTVHLGSSRDERSGEHSAVMLDPRSETGERLRTRHAEWFRRRLPGMLPDSLASVDPDVIRAVCASTPGTISPNLSAFEWRIAAGLPHGAAVHSTAPRVARQLTLAHLTDPESTSLTPTEERLLVMRALQCRPVETVATACEFPSGSACMRAFGNAVAPLVERYGDETIVQELERLR